MIRGTLCRERVRAWRSSSARTSGCSRVSHLRGAHPLTLGFVGVPTPTLPLSERGYAPSGHPLRPAGRGAEPVHARMAVASAFRPAGRGAEPVHFRMAVASGLPGNGAWGGARSFPDGCCVGLPGNGTWGGARSFSDGGWVSERLCCATRGAACGSDSRTASRHCCSPSLTFSSEHQSRLSERPPGVARRMASARRWAPRALAPASGPRAVGGLRGSADRAADAQERRGPSMRPAAPSVRSDRC